MRVQGKQSNGPSWIIGVVAFIVLLLIVQNTRTRTTQGRPLTQQFAARQPAPDAATSAPETGSGFSLPPLPAGAANLARTAVSRLAGGEQIAALTPMAEAGSLRVEIPQLNPTANGLQISGNVINVGTTALEVSLKSFRFTDETGTVFAAENGASTTLNPGQRAPLDLTLPITNPRQLTLEVELPNQPKLNLILLQAPPS